MDLGGGDMGGGDMGGGELGGDISAAEEVIDDTPGGGMEAL